MNKINLGIVGLGPLSQTIHIPCFSKNRNTRITAFCDHNKHLLSSVSSKYRVLNTYTNVGKMIKNEKLNAIVLVVQRPNTFSVSKEILKLKVNLLVEKPMALNLKQAKELVKIQKKNKTKYVIAYMKRSDDAVNYLKNKIVRKNFGPLISAYYKSYIGRPQPITKNFINHKDKERRKKYSLNLKHLSKKKIFERYLNVHCHSINLIRYIFGPIRTKKILLNKLGEGSVFFENRKKIKIELKNKFLLDQTWEEFIKLKFKKGYIKIKLQNPFNTRSNSQIITKKQKEKINIKNFKKSSFLNQSKNFVNYIKKNKINVLSNGEESLKDIQTIEYIFRKN
tara:strand:+ start:5648 stop:6658 length:1011 start_codon:yes stop_codon:yes gene_type:complete